MRTNAGIQWKQNRVQMKRPSMIPTGHGLIQQVGLEHFQHFPTRNGNFAINALWLDTLIKGCAAAKKYLTSLKITTISVDVPLCADVAVFIIFVSLCVLKYESTKATTVISSGVQPYWIGDLDTIIMKNPELYTSHGGFHENRKSLSQQLEPPYTTQVFVFTVWDGLIRYWWKFQD